MNIEELIVREQREFFSIKKNRTYHLRSTLDRFMEKVRKQSDGCWIWTGCKVRLGYGRFRMSKQCNLTFSAHQVSWALFRGSVEGGKELDHLCRVPSCVNPDHLEPVPHRENILRGTGFAAVHARKINCNRGHPYSQENTIYYQGKSGIMRRCRACITARERERGIPAKIQKLFAADVREIRFSKDTNIAISKRYGVTQSYISHIRRGDCWRSVSTV